MPIEIQTVAVNPKIAQILPRCHRVESFALSIAFSSLELDEHYGDQWIHDP